MNIFSDALWIWNSSLEVDERDRRVQFRRTFELENVPSSMEVRITADSCYTLWVNGEYVNRGPARGFQSHWPFDRVDLAPFLRPGKNVLAVLGYQYGVSNFSYVHEWSAGFLLAGEVNGISLNTGAGWKMREAPGYLRAVARGSKQYCFQEFFDCRLADDDWQQIDYDDSEWQDVTGDDGRAVGCMPWHDFEERGIPLLTHDTFRPVSLVSRSSHKPAADWQRLRNIGFCYAEEKPEWRPAAESGEKVTFPKGVTAQVLDFGREVVGNLLFCIEEEIEGEALDFMVCESMTGDAPDFPDCSCPPFTLFGGRLILRKGQNSHELTLPWGFRYLVLFRRGNGEMTVAASVRQTVYDLQETGAFLSSDEQLNAIWNMSKHTQRCCMVDAYIDCPWRENSQWWGDALVQSQNTFRLSADTRLFERGLRQLAEQKTPNGLTYGMAPTCAHHCVLPDYSAMWIVTLYAHYFQTGNIAMWLELRDTADGILEYFRKQAAETGLAGYDDRYWLFLDWSPNLYKRGCPALLNLIWLWALQSAAKLAEITGDDSRRRLYDRDIRKLTRAISCRLYDSEKKILCDGLTPEGERVPEMSPHVAALAILLNIFPEQHDDWLHNILLPLLKNHREERILPSSYFMYYIFQAVKRKGHQAEVVDCIRRWWGDFLQAGCSTTPENWLEKIYPGYMSMCHAWSAHPLVHLADIVLGVRQLAPGWKKIAYDPLMIPGQRASGAVPTPLGLVKVSWDWTGDRPVKKIHIPEEIVVIEDNQGKVTGELE